MPNEKVSQKTEDTTPTFDDLFYMVNDPAGTPASRKCKALNAVGQVVNAQTGTTYTVLTTDFRRLITFTNGSSIAVTLPQAGASFPANWYCFVQNRGAGAVTITPTTSTVDGAATLVLNQNEGALIVSDGSNYFTMRGKSASGAGAEVGANSDITSMDGLTGALENPAQVIFPEAAAPSTPGANKVTLYAKSDGLLYSKDDVGTETVVTGGAGGGISGLTAGKIPQAVSSTALADSPLTVGASSINFPDTSWTFGWAGGTNFSQVSAGCQINGGEYVGSIRSTNGTPAAYVSSNVGGAGGVGLKSTAILGISSGNADQALDTGIARAAAGKAEVNNGTLSTVGSVSDLRDLLVRQHYVDQTVTAGGTTGNQTINKAAGTVNIAAAGTTVTVTNSLVSTSSIVLAVIRTNDATAYIKNVVPGSGSFVINLGAAATAEISIGFVVINK